MRHRDDHRPARGSHCDLRRRLRCRDVRVLAVRPHASAGRRAVCERRDVEMAVLVRSPAHDIDGAPAGADHDLIASGGTVGVPVPGRPPQHAARPVRDSERGRPGNASGVDRRTIRADGNGLGVAGLRPAVGAQPALPAGGGVVGDDRVLVAHAARKVQGSPVRADGKPGDARPGALRPGRACPYLPPGASIVGDNATRARGIGGHVDPRSIPAHHDPDRAAEFNGRKGTSP